MATKNWPQEFTYISGSFSSELHVFLIDSLFASKPPKGEPNECDLIANKSVHPSIEVRILEETHPLSKSFNPNMSHEQRGVFASASIGKKEVLGEYAGEIFTVGSWSKKKRPSAYAWVFSINKRMFFIDGSQYANELAFVNDYRNISKGPNVEEVVFWHKNRAYFGYQTIRKIEKDEELLIDYKENYWETLEEYKQFLNESK